MRVWERGSGITQACGTGACATAVAAHLTGRTGRTVNVVMDGGTLTIEWDEATGHISMTDRSLVDQGLFAVLLTGCLLREHGLRRMEQVGMV